MRSARLLSAIFLASSLAVSTGCAASPPPVSEKVQQYYEQHTAKPTMATKPLAVFLGDSYTQGTGASTPAKNWVSLVAAAEGWGFDNLGRGGTGYVATSDVKGCGLTFCPNYSGMIDTAVAGKPSVVVVAGGQNDFTTFNQDPAKVQAAISETFKSLRAKLPNATIVAVGPSTPWGVGGPAVGLDRAVQDAAASVKAKYVSLIEPNVIDPSMVIADKAHVNDAGHAAIAERVEAALR